MVSMLPEAADTKAALLRLRVVLGLFIVGLLLSGITAFPLQTELEVGTSIRGLANVSADQTSNSFDRWIVTVRDGVKETYAKYPWIAYGTDWLAFAHIIIAIFFIGPLMDPVRNVWVIQAGLIACVLVIPLALICGPIREIPFGWRLIDCSFGVFGGLPLIYCLKLIKRLQAI